MCVCVLFILFIIYIVVWNRIYTYIIFVSIFEFELYEIVPNIFLYWYKMAVRSHPYHIYVLYYIIWWICAIQFKHILWLLDAFFRYETPRYRIYCVRNDVTHRRYHMIWHMDMWCNAIYARWILPNNRLSVISWTDSSNMNFDINLLNGRIDKRTYIINKPVDKLWIFLFCY